MNVSIAFNLADYRLEEPESPANDTAYDTREKGASDKDKNNDKDNAEALHFLHDATDGVRSNGIKQAGPIKGWEWEHIKGEEAEVYDNPEVPENNNDIRGANNAG